ncbi:hypothetical protein B0H13DRAFT_1879238 [Mycena leptocephala]|nr:hypothetical protein B0H13DRAFT_1879238 [Mycena leptocephala]
MHDPGSKYLARLMPPSNNDSAWIHGEIWDQDPGIDYTCAEFRRAEVKWGFAERSRHKQERKETRKETERQTGWTWNQGETKFGSRGGVVYGRLRFEKMGGMLLDLERGGVVEPLLFVQR